MPGPGLAPPHLPRPLGARPWDVTAPCAQAALTWGAREELDSSPTTPGPAALHLAVLPGWGAGVEQASCVVRGAIGRQVLRGR